MARRARFTRATPLPYVPPPPDAVLFGWQLTATNTGLAGKGIDKATLPAYTGGIFVPAGTSITLQRIDTELSLKAGNITIDRCWIRPATASPGLPLAGTVNYNNTAENPGQNVVLLDCDIDGSLIPNDSQSGISSNLAWEGLGSLYRCHIYNVGSGIAIRNSGTVNSAVVEGCYVHALQAWGDPDTNGSHNEAATVRDFASINSRTLLFKNNRFDGAAGVNSSGSMFNQGSGNGYGSNTAMANVTLEGNLFESGPYNLVIAGQPDYPMGYSNWRARNNRFTGATFGPVSTATGPGWTEWTDNYLNDPAQPDNRGAVVNP